MEALRTRVATLGQDKAQMEAQLVSEMDKAGALAEATGLERDENFALAQRLEAAQFETAELKKARAWSESMQAQLQRKLGTLEQTKKAARLEAARLEEEARAEEARKPEPKKRQQKPPTKQQKQQSPQSYYY